MAQIFNSQTRLPCSALSQPCSCLVSESSNVGSKQAAGASKAIFEAMVVIKTVMGEQINREMPNEL